MNYRNALFKISGDCFITVQYHNENTEHKQIVPAVGTRF
jgi:hypothetical protein